MSGPTIDREESSSPRGDDFPEDDLIGPTSPLSPQMPSARIDPCALRHIAAVEQQMDIRNRDLSVLHSGDDQHRRRRFAENLLCLQG